VTINIANYFVKNYLQYYYDMFPGLFLPNPNERLGLMCKGLLYVFVVMCNKVSNVANARKWQDSVCEVMLKYNGR